MRAVIFDGELHVDVNYPLPQRHGGEALIRMTTAGICNTDLEIAAGYMGFKGVPGHEFVGIVEETDDPNLAGQRVVGEINCGCGMCEACKVGLERHCLERSVLGILGRDGAFAEYLVLPQRNLHIVPAHLDDERAVFAEPLAAAFEILEQVQIPPTALVVVLGDGKLGQLVAQVLRLTGCHVVMLGHHPNKLEVARSLGIEATVLEQHSLPRADVVVECTGSSRGLALAATLVRPRGTVVLKSTVAGNLEINVAPFVVDEITVIGSRCGPFEPALRALEQGTVTVKPLITAQYSLADGLDALHHASQRDCIKVLLHPWQMGGDRYDPVPRRLVYSGVRPPRSDPSKGPGPTPDVGPKLSGPWQNS